MRGQVVEHHARPRPDAGQLVPLGEGGGLARPEQDRAPREGIATVIRVTGGNFRLLPRLLTQIGQIVEINDLHDVTRQVVEAARESLVIGAV